MKIVMLFHMNNDQYERIVEQDKHPIDILDELNEMAQGSDPEDVWHIDDEATIEIIEAVNKIFKSRVDPLERLGDD